VRLSVAALPLLLLAACASPSPPSIARLHYLTTARQLGPVGYRDPLGAISPDGAWLAFSVQQHLYVQPADGGPVRELPVRPGLIVHLVWFPDSRHVAVDHRSDTLRWWRYDRATDSAAPLWPAGIRLRGTAAQSRALEASPDSLRQLTWSVDGLRIAGVRETRTGSELWQFSAKGDSAEVVASAEFLSFPAFAKDGRLACLADDGTRQRISFPCGTPPPTSDTLQAFGPLAFSPDGSRLYFASPNPEGAVDLWVRNAGGGAAVRLTSLDRDSYAPTVTRDGAVLFKLQTYRTVVGVVAADGGEVSPLATFQSETPSWDPTGKFIGITYGTWRRVIDDFRYPDIAQDAGIIAADPALPAARPLRVVDASPSEDQSLCWSPNGKWIVYHSHKDQGDDLYLAPADLSAPAKRITGFGRGFETGWPRWSPDGKWVAFGADSRDARRHPVIYVMGIDQATGTVTRPEQPVATAGFEGDGLDAEWLPDSEHLVVHGFERPDRHALFVVPRQGGAVREVHRYRSEHRFSGIGLSPDGKWVAFPAPAPDGYFQLFRVPITGGVPRQLTFDPSNKTQPSYAPDGRRLALTVWEYQVQFWMLRP
jgi:Tol biopolymer transport system component